MLAIAVVGLVIGGYLFMSWAGKASFAPLYSNLTAEDASAVTSDLTSRGIQYKLADDGGTILVPQAKVYQTRIDLSAKGLPSVGAKGYDLLDKQGITTSEFRQRVDYQRALEGELSKTIESIDGVQAATVHLVIPADDIFSEDTRKPSASILVKNAPGKKMTSGQVQAVVHLVSSSVEGLDPTAVTVADAKGTVLSAPGTDGIDTAAGDARSAQTQAFEDQLAKSAQDMLVPVVGDGHAVVRVKADLDFDQRATTTEQFAAPPAGQQAPALQESTSGENYNGTGGGTPTGVLGPDGAPITNSGGNTTYTKNEANRTYAIGKTTEQAKSAPGAVKRLSVAVLLDGSVQGADAQSVTRLVSAAVGIDQARGDTIAVQPMTFDKSAQQQASKELEAKAAAEKQSQLFSLIKTVATLLIVAVVLLLALRKMAKAAAPVRTPIALPPLTPEPEAITTINALPIIEEPEPIELEPLTDPRELEAENARRADLAATREEVGELIEKQPEEVAQLLRSWLADRRS
jgi:flagellar M-ring protein FliF